MDHHSSGWPLLWHLCIEKQKDTQPFAAKQASVKIMEESLPSHLLTNVSGLSSLKELPAAVPVYEIAEHEKG
jgi:hypothetical protein